jgi:hypothetical protein
MDMDKDNYRDMDTDMNTDTGRRTLDMNHGTKCSDTQHGKQSAVTFYILFLVSTSISSEFRVDFSRNSLVFRGISHTVFREIPQNFAKV